MQKGHWIIVGTVGPLSVIGILIFIFGWCIVTICETQIEITSFETPKVVTDGQIIQADFVIMNTGNTTAENCVLRWGYNPNPVEYVNTDSFSLSPNEEIKIHLQSSSGARGYTSASSCWLTSTVDTYSDAWVLCENTDSGRSRNTILLECP